MLKRLKKNKKFQTIPKIHQANLQTSKKTKQKQKNMFKLTKNI